MDEHKDDREDPVSIARRIQSEILDELQRKLEVVRAEWRSLPKPNPWGGRTAYLTFSHRGWVYVEKL